MKYVKRRAPVMRRHKDIDQIDGMLLNALAYIRMCVKVCNEQIEQFRGVPDMNAHKLYKMYRRLLAMYLRSVSVIEKIRPTFSARKVSSIMLSLTKAYNSIKRDFFDKFTSRGIDQLRKYTGQVLHLFVKVTMVANSRI